MGYKRRVVCKVCAGQPSPAAISADSRRRYEEAARDMPYPGKPAPKEEGK
jgi:hypothetical protein